ncbi:ABC transporter permease [Clostridium minihomine]|uniref:ABC transporter permease n=1 Tax=Clostridium minihomine TaxID=2045012 RepID=UPI000C7695C9|nr:proline/glycine betaine ABC transporter permease [Clostridium minihomine]
MYRLPIGDYVERAIDWLTVNLAPFFNGIKEGLSGIIGGFEFVFNGIPFYIMIALFALLAWRVAGRGTGIFTIVGLLLIVSMNLWTQTMETLALVVTSTFIALLLGLPLGIWMSRSDKANNAIRPVLDFMQTMPAFVYLIPAVYFFDLGEVPGAVATVIFAMPPVVRLTSLGIRQVPLDVVEASRAFGSTSGQLLWKVQIPMAMPTILAGLNQTILLSLSMVVISAMIGAGGLGNVVLQGITQMKMGQGFEGGLAVVILAMVIDRITQSLGKGNRKSLFSILFKKGRTE